MYLNIVDVEKLDIILYGKGKGITRKVTVVGGMFKEPAYSGQMIVLLGQITYVGRTSMEVRVDTYTEALDGTRKMINRAYLTMVAIDNEGAAVEVPSLILETEEQQAEYEAAIKRKEMRKQRRLEHF